MIDHIKHSLTEAQQALNRFLANDAMLEQVEAAAKTLTASFENGHRVFSCGNGGSMCDATHFAEELTGRYRRNRKAYPAIAINDSSHITCVANDFGYDHVFSRYLEAHGQRGDCLIAISTSGNSQTVINAATTAKALGIKVIALTGNERTGLNELSDVYISAVGGEFADRVQEMHIKILHILIELVERHFHPENYDRNRQC